MSDKSIETSGAAMDAVDPEFEALLERALRVPLPEEGRHTRQPAGGGLRWRWPAVAAVALLAVGVTFGLLKNSAFIPGGSLAGDVVAHINHEPRAISPRPASDLRPVSNLEVTQVLQAAGADMSDIGPIVRYAKLCPFRGTMVAHFVVQGDGGPVTVMLLPEEQVTGPVDVDEDGFVGTIVPLDIGGSIAIVGAPGESLEQIQREVAAALRWRL
jgi:hypothetical protein